MKKYLVHGEDAEGNVTIFVCRANSENEATKKILSKHTHIVSIYLCYTV